MTLLLNHDEIGKILTINLCLDVVEHLYREYGQDGFPQTAHSR